MKNRIVIVFVIICWRINITAQQTIWLDNNPNDNLVSYTILESTPSNYRVHIHINGIDTTLQTLQNTTFCKVFFDKKTTLCNYGEPSLPTIKQCIGIPNGANTHTSITEIQWDTINIGKIYPYQKEQKESDVDTTFYYSSLAYTESQYNSDLISLSDIQNWCGINNTTIQLCPFHYYPQSGLLLILKDFILSIHFESTDNRIIMSVKDDLLDFFDNTNFLETTDNPSLIYEKNDSLYDYLIIVGNNDSILHSQSLQDFRKWKAFKGYKTQVVSTTVTGTSANSIKNYISSEYAKGVRYVLFIGDDNVIPMKNKPGLYDQSSNIKSDYWYGCIDGENDYEADISIGRFSSNYLSEIERMIYKSIYYECESNICSKNVLLMAHKENAPYKYQKCCEDIRLASYTDSLLFTTAYGAAPASQGNSATNSDVINAINNNLNILNYRGHGSFDLWGKKWNSLNESFTSSLTNQLTNSFFPIVFSVACKTGDIRNQTCLMESFMRSEHGSSAMIAATEDSYTYPNNYYNNIIFDLLLNHKKYKLGWLNIYAHIQNIRDYSQPDAAKDNAFAYLCGGDPTLEIWTDIPQEFNNVSISNYNNSLVINDNLVDSCNVAVINDDGELFAFYESAHLPLSLNTFPNNCYIVLSRHNYVPYIIHCDFSNFIIQNKVFNDIVYYSNENPISVGYNVSDSIPYGNVIINDKSSLIIENRGGVYIKNGFECKQGGTLIIK